MPNWVYNSVNVSGEAGEVETLVAKLGAQYVVDGREVKQAFAFWNIVKPTDLDAYNEVVGSKGRSMSDPLGWYEWNIRNWGCKWEARCDDEEATIVYLSNQDADVSFHFETAWSAPEPIIRWLVEYCAEHELSMEWHYEEEQGWGGEVIINEYGTSIREWDIPCSHEETKALDKECVCEYDVDRTYWFSDCPEPTEERLAFMKAIEEERKARIAEMAKEVE
jgi:Ferredoxin-like domain in Api92-like protein